MNLVIIYGSHYSPHVNRTRIAQHSCAIHRQFSTLLFKPVQAPVLEPQRSLFASLFLYHVIQCRQTALFAMLLGCQLLYWHPQQLSISEMRCVKHAWVAGFTALHMCEPRLKLFFLLYCMLSYMTRMFHGIYVQYWPWNVGTQSSLAALCSMGFQGQSESYMYKPCISNLVIAFKLLRDTLGEEK